MSDFSNTRRNFLKTVTSSTILSEPLLRAFIQPSELPLKATQMQRLNINRPKLYDGPHSSLFSAIHFAGNRMLSELKVSEISEAMADAVRFAPTGNGTAWGIPFEIPEKIILIKESPFEVKIKPLVAKWLLFLHTSDFAEMKQIKGGFYETPFKGFGRLNYIFMVNRENTFRLSTGTGYLILHHSSRTIVSIWYMAGTTIVHTYQGRQRLNSRLVKSM